MGRFNTTKQFSAVLGMQRQSIKQLNELVAKVAGLAGCEGCGRLAYIDLHFHDDPIAEFKDIVISQGMRGF
nr:hypothetical protein [Sphingomonas sp. Y57]